MSKTKAAITLQEVIDRFIVSPQFDAMADESIRSYRRGLKYFAVISRKPAGSLTRTMAVSAIKGLPDGAKRQSWRVLKAALSWAQNEGVLEESPLARATLKTPRSRPHSRWTDEEIARVLDACKRDLPMPKALCAYQAIKAFLETGQRKSDVYTLHSSDYDGVRLCVLQQKTGKMVRMEPEPFIADRLRDLGADGGYIIDVPHHVTDRKAWIERAIKHYQAKAGVEKTVHGLRKAVACRAAERGATDAEIQALMGHSDPRQTAHYRREADESMLATRALKKAG